MNLVKISKILTTNTKTILLVTILIILLIIIWKNSKTKKVEGFQNGPNAASEVLAIKTLKKIQTQNVFTAQGPPPDWDELLNSPDYEFPRTELKKAVSNEFFVVFSKSLAELGSPFNAVASVKNLLGMMDNLDMLPNPENSIHCLTVMYALQFLVETHRIHKTVLNKQEVDYFTETISKLISKRGETAKCQSEISWKDTTCGFNKLFIKGLPEEPESTDPAGTESTDPAGTESTDPAGTESTDPAGTESTDPAGTESTDPAGTESTDPAGTEPTSTHMHIVRYGHGHATFEPHPVEHPPNEHPEQYES